MKWRVTAVLLAAVFAYSVWRAVHVPIVIDEAYTYTDFVEPPLWKSLTFFYDANNHVLHSLLCRVSVAAFGLSEWSLRLPALAGTALYLIAVFLICRKLFADSWVMPACALFVAAHPTVLEFLSLARGYGLALGCWLYAVWLVMENRWTWVGVWLGLCLAFNLIFLVPIAALFVVTWRQWKWYTPVTFVLVSAAILAVPLSLASRENFYAGVTDLWDSAVTVLGAVNRPRLSEWLAWLLSAGIAVCLFRSSHPQGKLFPRIAVVSLAALVVGHWVTKAPYPYWRTGLYWVTLAGFCFFLALPRKLAMVGLAAVIAFLPTCLAVCPPDHSTYWQFNSSNRRLIERLRTADASGVMAVSPGLDHSMRFYSRMFGLENLVVIRLDHPDPPAPPRRWLLMTEDHALIQSKGLVVEYRDSESGVVLARLADPVQLH